MTTDPLQAAPPTQAFEAFPKLAAHIEYMGSHISGVSLSKWGAFLAEINATIDHLKSSAERTGRLKPWCSACGKELPYCQCEEPSLPPAPPAFPGDLHRLELLICNSVHHGGSHEDAGELAKEITAEGYRKSLPTAGTDGCHGLDTPERVRFYEHDFYVLSNFSAFSIMWNVSPREGLQRFDTSEAVYHWEKFNSNEPDFSLSSERGRLRREIKGAPSAHEAFKLAERNKRLVRADWPDVKVGIMRDILRAKAQQHEYVRRKLLATGERELVEDSWRDDFWGWGPNRDGKNMLGKLWMEIRAELRAALHPTPTAPVDPSAATMVAEWNALFKGHDDDDLVQALKDQPVTAPLGAQVTDKTEPWDMREKGEGE